MPSGLKVVPSGYGLLTFDEIDSTNEEARRQALDGEPGPLWILARRQTAGRGRRGRVWESPSGNLMATVLLRPQVPAAKAATMSFALALAAHRAILKAFEAAAITQAPPVSLKWPNDVLISGRKVCGILLESGGGEGGSDITFLAAGIGINLAMHPEAPLYPSTSLKDHGLTIAPEAMLSLVSAEFDVTFQEWQSEGFTHLRELWLAAAEGLGQPIVARLASQEVSGTFIDLDTQGRLCLRLADNTVRLISSGEVFFPEHKV